MKVKANWNFAYLGKAYKGGKTYTVTTEAYEAIKSDVTVIAKKQAKKVQDKQVKGAETK